MLANLQELENSGDFEKGGLESRKSQNKRNQKKVSADSFTGLMTD